MIDYDKVMRIGKQVLEDMYHRGYFDGQKDLFVGTKMEKLD